MSNINFPSFPDGFKDSPFGKDDSESKRGRYQFKFLKEEDVTRRERGVRRLSTRKADVPNTGRRGDVALGGTDVYQWVFEKQGEGIVMKIEFVMRVKDNLEKAFVIVNSEAVGAIVKRIIIPKLNAYRSTPLMKIIRQRFGSIDQSAWDAIWRMNKWSNSPLNQAERSAIFYTPHMTFPMKKSRGMDKLKDGATIIATHDYKEGERDSVRADYVSSEGEFIDRKFPSSNEAARIRRDYMADRERSPAWRKKQVYIHFHSHYLNGSPPSPADLSHYSKLSELYQVSCALISVNQLVGDEKGNFLEVVININLGNGGLADFQPSEAVYVPKEYFEGKERSLKAPRL